MNENTLALLAVGAVVLGCSSEGNRYPNAAGAADASSSATGAEEEEQTDGGSRDGGASGARLDLNLTVSEVSESGTPNSTVMFVVVRDAETREIVAIARDEENPVTKTKLVKKGALKRGHRYEIGAKDGWYAGCLDPSANVWFREIPAVEDHVQLDWQVRVGADEDARGCDVLHEPVPLPPGTYSTKTAINGVPGNRVTLYVSSTGRLYTKELRVFCATDSSSCVPTTLSHGACDLEQVVYPGETTFELGDSSASRTTVKGSATIDAAKGTVRYTGRTYTWTGTSSMCCDDNFDVTLEKVSGTPAPCD